MGKPTRRRILLDLIVTALSVTAAVFTTTALFEQWGAHQEALKKNLEPAQREVSLIDHVLKDEGQYHFLTSAALKEYARRYNTQIFDVAIENPKAEQKSPEDQDVIHRLQLLELKSDRLAGQLDKLSESKDQPWWKEPKTLWLFVLFFILEKLFSRVVGDLVGAAWEPIAKRIGIKTSAKAE